MNFAIISQPINLFRWAAAFVLIYVIFPVVIFPFAGDKLLERFFSRYVRMVAMTIIIGYSLVALKLYEAISILCMFIISVIVLRLPHNYREHAFRETKARISLGIYDFLDGVFHPVQFLLKFFRPVLDRLKVVLKEISTLTNCLQMVMFLLVLAYATYLRFYDALVHAAPSMSDAYVTLAWMKYIDNRILFHDGIYPQGFHIYLSILHKFAACDALYILKYTGPLNGVLATIGQYLLVEKITGRKLAGILSAFIFGVLGNVLPQEWARQGATNSQEFAIVFIFPAWYFALSYLQTCKKSYLWMASAAFLIIGLVHTLILGFLWVGLFCLVLAYLFLDFKNTFHSACLLVMAGVVTGLAAALPVPIAFIAGRKFNSASLEFLTQVMQMTVPSLTMRDILALVGFGLFVLISFFIRKSGYDKAAVLFVVCLGITSFLMYRYFGSITGNAVLVARLGILWSLLAPVGFGVGFEALLSVMPKMQNTLNVTFVSILMILSMVFAVNHMKPAPAQSYKMQYDQEINQYLRISTEYRSSEWVIVSSEEGYDLALGKGWHINLRDFLNGYDPRSSKFVKAINGQEELADELDYFIFIQKRLFEVNMEPMKPILANRLINYTAMEQWITKYRQCHDDLSIFYEDEFIKIYHIKPYKSKKDFEKIWSHVDLGERTLFL